VSFDKQYGFSKRRVLISSMDSQKGDIIHNSRKNNNSDDSLISEEDLKVAVIFPAKNEESAIGIEYSAIFYPDELVYRS
jgi:hypothetical protein